ncbi:MAG: hypothetical protein N2513_02555 [Deltaproteobacteria bacterium]|nr:hypothetical protein [Deltaproteobacteria bacterium]
MALDEPDDDDIFFETGGISFVIHKDLYEASKPIWIDFVSTPEGEGFVIKSSLQCHSGCCS